MLWVAEDGTVNLSPLPPGQTPLGFEVENPTMRARYERFGRGNGYAGEEAATDDVWMSALLKSLQREWPRAKTCEDVANIDHL